MITSAYATAGAFLRSAPEVAVPDLQLIFVIAIVDDHARKLHLGHGISCHVDLLHPFSRGIVGLNSTDPRDAPLIDPRFLSDERDLHTAGKRRTDTAAHHRIETVRPDTRHHALPACASTM